MHQRVYQDKASPEGTPAVGSSEWLRLEDAPHINEDGEPIRIVDLFSGCGGMSLGAREACREREVRPEFVRCFDFYAPAVAAYNQNLSPRLCSEPTDLGGYAFEPEVVDIVLAGPPCQGHSDLNNHTRRQDPRNVLYGKVAECAETWRPRWIIVENVPSVRHSKGKVLEQTIQRLKGANYHTISGVVHANDCGVAQRRKRHFLLASRDTQFDDDFLEVAVNPEPMSVRDAIADLEEEPLGCDEIFRTPSTMGRQNLERAAYLREFGQYNLPNRLRPSCHSDKTHSYNSMYGRMRWDEPAQTITTGFGSMGQGRYLHPNAQRMITPHEAARLQGFPDWFHFPTSFRRGELQKLIGNAVPPPLACVLVGKLLDLQYRRTNR